MRRLDRFAPWTVSRIVRHLSLGASLHTTGLALFLKGQAVDLQGLAGSPFPGEEACLA